MKYLGIAMTKIQVVFPGKLDVALNFKAIVLANKHSMFTYNKTNQIE